MEGTSSRRCRALVVGLTVVSAAACGDDGNGGAGTTTSVAVAPDATTTPTAATVPPTTVPGTTPASTTTPPTTVVATTTIDASTTSTIPAPVLPTWSAAVLLADAGPDSPFGVGGIRPRFASSDVGSVAVRPTSGETDAATQLWFSADALTWEPTANISGERLSSVVAGGPGFVAVGAADTDVPGPATSAGVFPRPVPVVRTSADGRTWTRATIDSGSFEFGDLDDVAVADGGLIAVGEVWESDARHGPAVWRSADGLAWTVQPDDPLGSESESVSMAVTAGAGGVVAIGLLTPVEADSPGPLTPMRAWWSPDGVSWERAPDIDSFSDGSTPAGVVPFGSGFVMVGGRGARVALAWTSPDGRTWADPVPLPLRPVTDSTLVFGLSTDGSVLIAYGDDVVFGEGTDPAMSDVSIWMSLDATDWQQVPPESLRGDALPGRADPLGLLHVGDEWVLLGTAFDEATDSGVGAAWFGRTDG